MEKQLLEAFDQFYNLKKMTAKFIKALNRPDGYLKSINS